MPGNRVRGGRRTTIHNWRVKAGKKEVFSREKKIDCENFMRENGYKLDGKKLKLIPPND
jgi:hypothetical protein